MKLTAKFIESTTAPGRYVDDGGMGLHFVVQVRKVAGADDRTRLTKAYAQRVTVRGRRVDIGLGSPRFMTLTEARRIARDNWREARRGGDPRAKLSKVPTFAQALESVLNVQRDAWRNGAKSENQWRASLRDYAGPLMNRPVDAIGPGDVLAVLSPIWNAKRETARRVRQRVAAVMKWSVAEGHRTDDPTLAIGAALPKNGDKRSHFKALPYGDVSGALATVRGTGAWVGTRLAFEFLTLTAARSGEVRGARWSEIDGDTWCIPAERMKAGITHRVPLSDAALAVLAQAREIADGSGLIFPSITGREMSDSTLSKLLKENGIAGTPHGMRSAFRDWASERTNTAHAVMESALAHTIRDRAEAAYARSDLLEKRRDLMNAWARYLTPTAAKVVALR